MVHCYYFIDYNVAKQIDLQNLHIFFWLSVSDNLLWVHGYPLPFEHLSIFISSKSLFLDQYIVCSDFNCLRDVSDGWIVAFSIEAWLGVITDHAFLLGRFEHLAWESCTEFTIKIINALDQLHLIMCIKLNVVAVRAIIALDTVEVGWGNAIQTDQSQWGLSHSDLARSSVQTQRKHVQ